MKESTQKSITPKTKGRWKNFLSFFDDKGKGEIKWWNKNYFFAGTIAFIILQVIIFAVANGNLFENLWCENVGSWDFVSTLKKLLIHIGAGYTHNSWDHLLGNMLGILFCTFYIERKTGSINLLGLIGIFSILCAIPNCFTNTAGAGASVIWFALFGYMLVDFIFSLFKPKSNIANIIIGVVSIVLTLTLCGFILNESGNLVWTIEAFRETFLDHQYHLVGGIIGFVLSLTIQILKFQKH